MQHIFQQLLFLVNIDNNNYIPYSEKISLLLSVSNY